MKIELVATEECRRKTVENLGSVPLDWLLVEEYFDLFEMHNLFAELKTKYAPH